MDDAEIDIRTLFAVLRRQIRLIAITFVVVVALAGLVIFALTPTYSSSALILFDPSSKNLLEPEAQLTSSSSDSARIDSEVELLRSDNILLKVIAAENLTADPEFAPELGIRNQLLTFLRLAEPGQPTGEEALNQTLSKFRSAFAAQRRGLTYLISIQARSESPAKAANLANAIARAYIADQLSSKVNSVMSSRDILQARLIEARNSVSASEGTFDGFITDNLARISQDTGRTDLNRLQAQIQQLQSARVESSNLVGELTASIEAGDWATLVANLQSDALDELQRQRSTIADTLSSTEQASPAAISLREELAAVDERLRSAAERQVSSLSRSISDSQEQESTLRQNLRSEVLNSALSADILTQLYDLQQTSELARSQYQTLLSRTQDLDTQANLQVADSRIVSAAIAPAIPSFPNNALFLAVAALLALGIGVGLAFLYEYLIGGFMSEEQVASVLRVKVATSIPRERSKTEKDSLANMVVNSPLSVYAESLRRLRASVEQILLRKGADRTEGSVVMVTSTAPNEGKTTLCLSLARSFAMAGQRTILIDCDLRKPSIHRHLGIDPSQGLLEFLAETDDESNIGMILKTDALSNATVVVGARRSNLPTDQLLSGAAFRRLIAAARRSYDVVVLDTPPIGPVVDGLYIARHADVCVFVARWASTPQGDAKGAVESLRQAGGPDFEVISVLNQQPQTRGSYQRKYGNYYQETA